MADIRLDMYLGQATDKAYTNSDKEQELVNKFNALYMMAKSAQESCEECNPLNLDKWRKAYYGTLNALKEDGTESNRKSRQFRKLVYEFVESKIDNSIPMPKMKPRYKTDLPLVSVTENYLKFEADTILTKFDNDRSERATYIDGTTWYKVSWDSLANTHERSGNVKIDVCMTDQITPQPGVTNYKNLEYIFERKQISCTTLYDLYNRVITSTNGDNMVEVISCYYLNDNRIVGLFMWASNTLQVICNEKDWQIRKHRVCKHCGTINPRGEICRVCGHTHFKYENATEETLNEDLYEIYNPYEEGETQDAAMKGKYKERLFLSAGSKVPYYHITQLPFVPRPAISSLNDIYGTSEVKILLEMQDGANKILTKAFNKTMKSGTVLTKPEKVRISDTDGEIKIIGVRSPEEGQMIQAKQVLADTSQDILLSSLLYESARSSSGVTESFQGKSDNSAVSGKAKQYAALQSAGRIESLRVMKSAAFAGLYELIFKYLLAFSDEPRKFVRVLPDGQEKEQIWNKYLFLAKDEYGQLYYRDDFNFDTDPASTLSQNRTQMWQETLEKFTMGAFGNPQDPRSLDLFWNIMNELQYPLAKIILAGIKNNERHLPMEVEQAIMANPELQEIIAQTLQQGTEQRGGARPNSGPAGNGATHAANVERTNERNRAKNKEQAFSAQSAGGNT